MGKVLKFPTRLRLLEKDPIISNELLDLRTWKLLSAIEELELQVKTNTRHVNFLIREIGKLRRLSNENST